MEAPIGVHGHSPGGSLGWGEAPEAEDTYANSNGNYVLSKSPKIIFQ